MVTVLKKVLKILFLIILMVSLSGCAKCIKSHEEIVHIPAHTIFVSTGKILVPQVFPASDDLVTICDEYEK